MISLVEFEKTLSEDSTARYAFTLYVAGATEKAANSIASLREIFDRHLAGRYELQVVDVYQEPLLAREARVLAVPTVVRGAPLPIRRLTGDLCDSEKVLAALDIPAGDR